MDCFLVTKRTLDGGNASVTSPAKKIKPETTGGGPRRMLKHVTVEQRVDKYKQYGLYNNDGALFCRPCGKRVDMHREDTIKDHIVSDLHESQVLKRVNAMYPYVFVGMQFFLWGGWLNALFHSWL